MEESQGTCTMSRYLDPTNDYAFQRLFGDKNHDFILIGFLNAILGLKGSRVIKTIQFIPEKQRPIIKGAKSTILDVKCTDARGSQYIVEMQNKKMPAFIKRAQAYAAHSYILQLSSGEDYVVLKPVILLCIANHVLFPGKDKVVSYHETLDKHSHENDLKDLSYVFVELPKFDKTEQELITMQDKWLYFFKNWNHDSDIPSAMQEKELVEAYHFMDQFNWTSYEREAYFRAQIALTDEFTARQAERAEGKAEGKVEKAREVAHNLLKLGMSISEISTATGLLEEDIHSL